LPSDVNIRADYEAATATVELINVRRFGRFTVRLATEAFKEAIDDLARYVLGVDEDFQKLIAKAWPPTAERSSRASARSPRRSRRRAGLRSLPRT
jgi:hypothetical protein